jgi:hypothetical protein
MAAAMFWHGFFIQGLTPSLSGLHKDFSPIDLHQREFTTEQAKHAIYTVSARIGQIIPHKATLALALKVECFHSSARVYHSSGNMLARIFSARTGIGCHFICAQRSSVLTST